MLNRIRKITALFMAIVVFLSTISFTVNMHYCGKLLVDTSMFTAADDCGMQMEAPADIQEGISEKKCCDDRQFFIEGQNELKTASEIPAIAKQFHAQLPPLNQGKYLEIQKTFFSKENYTPPKIIKPFRPLYQVYII